MQEHNFIGSQIWNQPPKTPKYQILSITELFYTCVFFFINRALFGNAHCSGKNECQSRTQRPQIPRVPNLKFLQGQKPKSTKNNIGHTTRSHRQTDTKAKARTISHFFTKKCAGNIVTTYNEF